MITADKLALLTNFPHQMLTKLIRQAGYKEDTFVSAKFLGLTNGGDFCYLCTYKGEFEDTCKVFVRYDPTTDKVSAEY